MNKKKVMVRIFVALIFFIAVFAIMQMAEVKKNKTPQAKLLTGEMNTK